MVYQLLHAGRSVRRQIGNLFFKCLEMLAFAWEVSILYIFREENQAVDWLASYSLQMSMGFHECEEPPNELQIILSQDRGDFATPWVV